MIVVVSSDPVLSVDAASLAFLSFLSSIASWWLFSYQKSSGEEKEGRRRLFHTLFKFRRKKAPDF